MLILIKLLLITSIFAMVTLATTITAHATNTFLMTPELPENQNPESLGSFNLDVKAGQSQEIEVLVTNHSDDFITVEISLINPGTNRSGVIDFSQSGNMDPTLEVSFSDIAHLAVDPVITIPAGGTARVSVSLQIPDNGFNGVLFGAIHARLTASQDEMTQTGQFADHFTRVIPVRLFINREFIIAPNFELGEIDFDLIAGVAAIEVNIRNPKPRFSIEAAVSAQIFPADSKTPIFTITDLEVDFAPSSVYSLTLLDNAGFGILSGEYIARIQVDFDGKIWSFEQWFNITSADSIAVNSRAINQHSPPQQLLDNKTLSNMMLRIISAAAGVTIIFCIALVVSVKTKQKDICIHLERD